MTIKCFCLFSLLYRFLFYINVCLYKIVTLKYIYSSYYNTGISFQFLKLKKKITHVPSACMCWIKMNIQIELWISSTNRQDRQTNMYLRMSFIFEIQPIYEKKIFFKKKNVQLAHCLTLDIEHMYEICMCVNEMLNIYELRSQFGVFFLVLTRIQTKIYTFLFQNCLVNNLQQKSKSF